MPKLLENRNVYDLVNFSPQYFLTYTSENIGNGEVRHRATLFKDIPPKQMELLRGSLVCNADADPKEELRQHAVEIFERPIARALKKGGMDEEDEGEEEASELGNAEIQLLRELKALRKQVYGTVHPLRRFLDSHYGTIALLYDWAPSTIDRYWNTLTNQLIPNMKQKEIPRLTATDFDEAIVVLEEKFLKNQRREYSQERVGQFFSNLYSVMEYAADYYGIPNVLQNSRYYERFRGRYWQEPLEKRIEKHLRIKSMDLEEEARSAQLILGLADKQEEKKNGKERISPVGTGVGAWEGLRPSEICGLHYGSRIPFALAACKGRNYLLVQTKVTPKGEWSPDLKTINGYRALPLSKVMDLLMDQEIAYAQETYGVDEETLMHRPVVTKDGKRPLKPKELSGDNGKILRQSLKAANEKRVLAVPARMDEGGELIPLEENDTSYQYRRNFSSSMLNKLGFPLKTVQGMLGHEIPEMRGIRWMLYNEEELAEQMECMDQLVFFPIADEGERMHPWEQTDPRKEIRKLDPSGEFRDAATLRLAAEPYSETDQVTVRLEINMKEPSDKISLDSIAETSVAVEADTFFGKKRKQTPLNNLNAYWDMVFSVLKRGVSEWNETESMEDSVLDDETEVDYIQQQYEKEVSELDPEESWSLSGNEVDEMDLSGEDV